MLPYNRKLFGRLDDIGTYWLYKLPNVSFCETIMSCMAHKFYGKYPGQETVFYYKSEVRLRRGLETDGGQYQGEHPL